MPIIIVSGLPCSGKTTRVKQLKEYFVAKGKKVEIVSENIATSKAGFHKNELFADSQKEKIIRSDLKSEVIRLLNKEDVIILDAGNYIKGYRYELFCSTKLVRTTQCTLFCAIQKDVAWKFNENRISLSEQQQNQEEEISQNLDNSNVPYSREIFDALCLRFEEPNDNCRWDHPLFVIFPDDELNFEGIFDALYSSKPLPPNLSTQNPPLRDTNYLFELDKITKTIIDDIIAARKIGVLGSVPIKNTDLKVDIDHRLNAAQLNRLRRQFINYSKMQHTNGSSLDKIPHLFVQFLNSNSNK